MKTLPKKRRLRAITNYVKRKRLLESERPRIVIRKTNKYITAQYIESEVAQDKVKYSSNSKELLNMGWPEAKKGSLKSIPAAYLTGILLGKRIIKEKEIPNVDFGLIRSTKGSRIYAVLKGIIDSGVKMGHNVKMFPDDKKIISDNVKDFFDKVKAGVAK